MPESPARLPAAADDTPPPFSLFFAPPPRERRRSEIVSHAVLENLRDHLILVGAVRDANGGIVDWRVLEVSQQILDWFQRSRADAARLTIRELLPERFADLDARWRAVLAGGESYEYESAAGETALLVRVFRIDPDIVGSAAFDITDRKRAESALRANEARFRALIEKSVEVIAMLDATGTLTYWSPGSTAVLGWPAEEIVGTDLRRLVHADDLPAVEAAIAQVCAAPGHTAALAARVRHRDGSWRPLEGVGRNLLDDPELRAIVVHARDLGPQRQLEEKFRQAQKLESVGRLAGGVAHDFNNLLTVILNCAAFLEQDRRAGRFASAEHIEQIRAAGERAGDLTRQLLAFARKQVIAPVPLDLNVVVRASEKLLLRVLGEDVELAVRTEPGLPPVVADRGQIEQALMNLVVNARDAMPDGGRIEIETHALEVSADDVAHDPTRRPGAWVRLGVRDTGCGMPPEIRAHLFEPFFTTKEQGKGTGLGLATVHGIVSQSGGHIHVHSTPGHGTTFELCFPRAAGPLPAASPAPAPGATDGHETVLVIEDDPLVRGVTTGILQRAGYRVLEARHGREALEVAAAAPVELVLTDVIMPGMNGPDAVRALRARRPGLRALYVSGYLEDSNALRGVPEAERDVLGKPFGVAALLARVRAALDGPAPAAG